MGELINQYRLVLMSKKKNEGVFKLYYYFNKSEEGMNLIRKRIEEAVRMANDKRFDYLYKDLEYEAYAIEEYKKTVEGDEMSVEIKYKKIRLT